MIQETPTGLQLHQEVDVALFVRLAPGDGAKDPHVTRAVFGGDLQDLFALFLAFGSAAGWVAGAWQGQSRATRLGATAIAPNSMHLGEAGTIRGQAGLPVGL